MNRIEVELRALVENTGELKQRLEEQKIQLVETRYLKDSYFCHKSVKSLAETEQNEIGDYALRLRKSKKDAGEAKTSITAKIVIDSNNHDYFEEYETIVKDYDEMKKILEKTEFKSFFDLEKTRYIYSCDDMEICVEDIVDFGGAIEVEIMTSADRASEAREKIRKFLNDNGISDDMLVPKTVTSIIMHERAKF